MTAKETPTHCIFTLLATLLLATLTVVHSPLASAAEMEKEFDNPPATARPWVYWLFMDGNLTREGITADLEAMQRAGIGGAIIMEVNVGIPRGPVEFMSAPWRDLIKHAIHEADRLGLEIALAAGPGWSGTGGPWVKPEQSMQHLVASETKVTGPIRFDASLPQPKPFGKRALPPELQKIWQQFYQDVVVLAFPTPTGDYRIPCVEEKALYKRSPYSSKKAVKPFLAADSTNLPPEKCIAQDKIVELELTNGRLVWDVPEGNWTILRFGRTLTGMVTRPAPVPGLGFESDKFDKAALDAHFESFIGMLLKTIGEPPHPGRGLTTVHFDSWEMSAQNWSEKFRAEFRSRRGYDLLRFLPVFLGRVVESVAVSERFLWDLRRTAQELVIENHALRLKELSRRHGLTLSIEPYDMNPAGDLALGAAADVPMCEFWLRGFGFNTDYSCFEAVSIAHTMGRPVVGAEAFTADKDAWRQHPGTMKAQGDWALCAGINRFVFHRYQHQPWLDRFPGMTFASYGVHWDRTQTWWEMASGYHTYLSRCQTMLRRGLPVADILYLDLEGAPNVFRPPTSAVLPGLPDRRGYNFDGCAPGTLIERARVKTGRITFPDGMSYRLLVLPRVEAMTPALLRKIKQLVNDGATVIGSVPKQSPSLENYPQCDAEVQQLAAGLWQSNRVICDAATPITTSGKPPFPDLYPGYDTTAQILAKLNVLPDFESDADLRYTHRHDKEAEIYFVGNRTAGPVLAKCRFRVTGRQPELWDPVTGERRTLPEFYEQEGRISVPLQFAPGQSYFVVFREKAQIDRGALECGGLTPLSVARLEVPQQADGRVKPRPDKALSSQRTPKKNFPEMKPVLELAGSWTVSFDPKWGGPSFAEATAGKPEKTVDSSQKSVVSPVGTVVFDKLVDWTTRPEPGIKYYSGTATYRKTFRIESANRRIFLDVGKVAIMARVTLNGHDCGVIWTLPPRVDITAAVKTGENLLEIAVANLWPNRLIGDAALPVEKRFTFTTWSPYKKDSPLLESGLLGPVRVMSAEMVEEK